MVKKTVLDVGQCDADHSRIRALLIELGVNVLRADSMADARKLCGTHDIQLVLVNRILDATGESGTDLIGELAQGESRPSRSLMLVSNYKEAQAEAVSRGAVPGFGKAELKDPKTRKLLMSTLER